LYAKLLLSFFGSYYFPKLDAENIWTGNGAQKKWTNSQFIFEAVPVFSRTERVPIPIKARQKAPDAALFNVTLYQSETSSKTDRSQINRT
jgi:hypothetical protein